MPHPVASSSSTLPSQSSSLPLQASTAPGFTALSLSLQSSPRAAVYLPAGAHRHLDRAGSPCPSPSLSRNQVSQSLASSSSTSPSQSSSLPLQASVASGFTAASPSAQSPPLVAVWDPMGADRQRVLVETPQVSTSTSRK